MQDYKPNSHRFKESQPASTPAAPEKKKIEKVITGKATVKPKGELAKLAETFFAEDIRKVKDYLIKEVIVPTIKDTIWTVIARGSERMLYGESGHAPKNSKLGHINYNNLFKQTGNPAPSSGSTSSQYAVDNIFLDNKGDAEKILWAMKSYIDQFGSVSISEMYDMLEQPIGDFMATRWGWRSLNTASVVRITDDCYKLNLPPAISLK